MDDSNAYAGRSEQIFRINQPITVATTDNIYKQMGSQRTKANIYKTGYRKTKAALQEQQRINAAITSTLAAQASNASAQPAVTPKSLSNKNCPDSSGTANSCTNSSSATTGHTSISHPCTSYTVSSYTRTISPN